MSQAPEFAAIPSCITFAAPQVPAPVRHLPRSHPGVLIVRARERFWLSLAVSLGVVLIYDYLTFVIASEYGVEDYEQHGQYGKEDYSAFSGPLVVLTIHGLVKVWLFFEHEHHAVLSAFTIGIFVVTASLAWYTFRLWSETRSLREDADAAAKRSQRQTVRALVISRRAATAAKDSVKLTRDAFMAAHRPRMKVRRASFVRNGEGGEYQLRYTIHNVGNTLGTVIAISQTLKVGDLGDDLRRGIRYAPEEGSLALRIEGGGAEERAFDVQSSVNVFEIIHGGIGLSPTKQHHALVGYLVYSDEAGLSRRTGFFREYRTDLKQFKAIDDPDYEYED